MKIKSLFFKPEEEKSKPIPIPPPRAIPSLNSGGMEYDNDFAKIMEQNNIQGLDFFEFTKALDSLSGSVISEDQKFKTVFATFEATGINKAKLIESAKFYQGKFEEHAKGFQTAIGAFETKEVSEREQEISRLQQENNSLNAKLTENSSKIAELRSSANTASIKSKTKQQSFQLSYQAAVSKVNEIIQKIQTYL